MQIRFSSDYGVHWLESAAAKQFPLWGNQLSPRWVIKPYLEAPSPLLQAATWVRLLELPHSCCHDEALLLCQQASDDWLGWIPDYGEVLLHRSQFQPV